MVAENLGRGRILRSGENVRVDVFIKHRAHFASPNKSEPTSSTVKDDLGRGPATSFHRSVITVPYRMGLKGADAAVGLGPPEF